MADEDRAARSFNPGEKFRQYPFVIEAFLGEGASGQVYAIRHVDTGDRFALKVSHLADRRDARKVARSLEEAKATYRMDHPNIVKVHDLGCEEDGLVWLRMELLEGTSLGQRLGRFGTFSPLYAIDLALEVCWGLQAAHERQVIHRDVNPSNLFLTREGRVLVIDFSLAKVMSAKLQTTVGRRSMGTPGYMAPEYLKGGMVTVQADVLALGVVLWQMMMGEHPFGEWSVNPQAFMRRQMHEDLPSLAKAAQLPAYVDEVILRMTANDPQQRFGNMWAVGQALLELRRRLVGDPAALERVQLTALERRSPLLLDATGRQGYQAPQELMGAVTAPPMPSRRVVVAVEAGAEGVGKTVLGKTEGMGGIEAARAQVMAGAVVARASGVAAVGAPVAAGKVLEKTEPMGAIEAARAQVMAGVVVAASGKGMGKTEPMGAIEAARARVTPATVVDAGGGAGGQRGSGIGGQGSSGVLLAGPAGGAGRGVTEIGGAAPTVRSGGKKVAGWVWGVVAVVVVGAIAVVVAVIAGVMRGAG